VSIFAFIHIHPVNKSASLKLMFKKNLLSSEISYNQSQGICPPELPGRFCHFEGNPRSSTKLYWKFFFSSKMRILSQ